MLAGAVLLGVAVAWNTPPQPKAVVPFVLRGGVPILTAHVNGEPHPFILDTGAGETVITPRVALAAGMPVRNRPDLQQTATVAKLCVGDAQADALSVLVFDPPQARPLRLNEGLDYAGLIGFTFLRRYVMEMDYGAGELRLHDPAGYRRLQAAAGRADGTTGVAGAAFDLVSSLVHTPGIIDGRYAVTCLLDTGAAEVVVTPGTAARLGLMVRALPKRPDVGIAVLKSLTVAGAERRGIEAIVHTIPQDRGRVVRYDVILGTPFLDAFRVTIDYPRKTLTLTSAAGVGANGARR